MISYNIKLENFVDFANLQTKLKPEQSSIILYCPDCCLTNCNTITHVNSKTIFVCVNW